MSEENKTEDINNVENTAENATNVPVSTEPQMDEAEPCVGESSVSAETNDSEFVCKEGEDKGKQINIASTKTTLSKRPWKLGAVQINTKDKNGNDSPVWVAAVIDSNGQAICCGDSVDMEFIIKMENSYDSILRLMNNSGLALAEAVSVLEDFECKKTKAFNFK